MDDIRMLLNGGYAMLSFDFSPLFRSTVGFDRVMSLLDQAMAAGEGGYPPYNIEKTGEDQYRIVVAVAGFAEEDLTVEQKATTLLVAGRKTPREEGVTFLHRGLAGRPFERRFELADHVRVVGARLANGLLEIELVREVPEALKPRRIAITGGEQKAKPTLIEGEKVSQAA
jgi:molecular chaperone IbpA